MKFPKVLIRNTALVLIVLALPLFAHAQVISIQDILWTFVNNVFGSLLGIAGLMLDGSIELFIVGFGNTFLNLGVGNGVDTAWVIMRDIFNLTFIFGLVWIGLKMILNSDDSNTRRWLVNLIMAALLVNFSLFITKFIVDFTNILASEIATSGFTSAPGISGATPQVSTTFMQMFGLSSVFDGNWINRAPAVAGAGGTGGYMYIFGSAIVFLIGAFCFFAGAFMIMIRFVALCIYMVFSPLMFLGWVFPQLQGVTSKYWSGFLGRAFFAPAYIMLIYLAAYIMGAFNSTAGSMGQALNPSIAGNNATAEVVINFALVSMFLIASVVVGNKLSADGAGVAIRVGNNARGRVQRVVTRNTAGYAATGVGNASEAIQRRYNRLDARMSQTKLGRAARGAATIATLGALSDRNVQAGLNAGSRATIAGSETGAQRRQRLQDRQRRQNTENESADRTGAVQNADFEMKKLQAELVQNTSLTDAEKAAINSDIADHEANIAKNTAKMTVEELAALPQELLNSEVIAKNLSDAQIKALADTGKYQNSEIKKLKDARTDGIYNSTTKGITDFAGSAQELNDSLEELNRNVSRWSTETLEGMEADKLADQKIATNLSQRQLDALRDSDKITTGDYARITQARSDGFEKIATSGSIADTSRMATVEQTTHHNDQRAKLFSLSAQDAGKMPASVYTSPEMAPYITPAALTQRVRNGGLTTTDITTIETNIKATYTPGSREEQMWKKWTNNSTEGARFSF